MEKIEEKEPGNVEPKESLVAQHYNSIVEEGHDARSKSTIFGLRKFNNWIKAVQIQDAVKRVKQGMKSRHSLAVLDLCCGKGGDLDKWRRAGTFHYIGLDIADQSIKQAIERQAHSSGSFKPEFLCMDCFPPAANPDFSPSKLLPWYNQSGPPGCHIVSCMFAFHYAFEQEEKACQAFLNISNWLLPGGIFIAAIPHEETIEERRSSSSDFGNSVYHISFPQPPPSTLYHFTLEDRVIDCPEYTVPLMSLYRFAKQAHLKLLYYDRFVEFYQKFKNDYRDLLHRFHLLSGDPGPFTDEDSLPPSLSLTLDEWEVVQLYAVVAFQKEDYAL